MSPRIASHPTYPSVTEVLKAVGLTRGSEHIPDRYRERGRALHELIAMYLDGLEVSNCPAELQPGLDAFREFEVKEGFVAEATELTLVHDPYGFVGTLDAVGLVKGARAICDWKGSDQPDIKGATLQVAGGYRTLWAHCHPTRPVERCYVVALRKDGTHRLHDVTDSGHAAQVFCSALVVFKEKSNGL